MASVRAGKSTPNPHRKVRKAARVNMRKLLLSLSMVTMALGLSLALNPSVASAWHANSYCVDNSKWVVENPNEEWATNATFTFNDDTVASPIEPGQQVAAPAAATHVIVTWEDYGTPHEYDRPNGCTPPSTTQPPVYEPSVVAYSECINDHAATISGTIAGFPKGPVTVSADRGDISFGWGEFENGAFSFGIDVFNELGPQDGPLTFSIVAVTGSYSASVLVEVQFQKCVEVTTTTAAPTTTAPPTTAATTTTTQATTTTTAATTTTLVSTTSTVTPTTKPTTSSTLPVTGGGDHMPQKMGLVLFFLGAGGLLIFAARRKPTMS